MECTKCATSILLTNRPRKNNLCRPCYQKQYRQENKDKIIKLNKTWYEANREKDIADSAIYQSKRMSSDIVYKLKNRLRVRLNNAIKQNYKSGSAVNDLGCSVEFLKSYLESKFESGMNWNNHSINGWHIDHIIPLSSFNLSNKEELKKACHYTNLQPLWSDENWKKGHKYGT